MVVTDGYLELATKEQPEPADAVQLRKYLELLEPGVERGVVSLEQHVVDVGEGGHQQVARPRVLGPTPRPPRARTSSRGSSVAASAVPGI